MQHPSFHHPRPVLPDTFGIGQASVAKHLAAVSRQAMHAAAPRAFRNMHRPACIHDDIAAGAMTTINTQAAAERQALAVMRAS